MLPGKVTVLCPELHATVAGVPKRAIEYYCRQNGFESFRSHLCLTGKDTFKTQMQYIDDVHDDYEITDYMGNTAIVSVGYGIYAEPAPFQMDMPRDFVRFLSGGYVSEKKQYLQSIHI